MDSNEGVSREGLLRIRELVCESSIALMKWGLVIDRIVPSEGDAHKIKEMLKDNHSEAVLLSLQIWNSAQGPDLIVILHGCGLRRLADTISDQKSGIRLNSGRVWFAVGQLSLFTGRKPELKKLHKMLQKTRSADSSLERVVLISGLGGIGKSALARKYAIEYAEFYDGNVIWINAARDEDVEASFRLLATHLNIPTGAQASRHKLANVVYEKLERAKCLFIFDGLNDYKHYEEVQKVTKDVKHCRSYVLITSRRWDLHPVPGNILTLDVLPKKSAVKLIRMQLDESSTKGAELLANKLSGLPLALRQGTAYISRRYGTNDRGIQLYLNKFDTSGDSIGRIELLDDKRFHEHDPYRLTTFTVWDHTLSDIRETDETEGKSAIKLINILSYLTADKIRGEFLTKVVGTEQIIFLIILRAYSMIKHGASDKVTILQLVQCVVRLKLSEEERASAMNDCVHSLTNELTSIPPEWRFHALNLFSFQQQREDVMMCASEYLLKLCEYLVQQEMPSDSLLIAQSSLTIFETIGVSQEVVVRMRRRVEEAKCRL